MSHRVALYIRVSTDHQADGYGPDAQRAEMRAYAERQGWEVVEEVEDASTGKNFNRPGIERLHELVDGRKVDRVMVAKRDRIGRNVREALALVDAMEKQGVQIVAPDGLDTGSAEGRMFMTMLFAVAEWEGAIISRRTSAAMRSAAKQGFHMGRPPVGFSTQATGGEGETGRRAKRSKLVVTDRAAAEQRHEVCHRAHQLHEDGLSLRAIGKQLEDDGMTTPTGRTTWSPKVVRDAVSQYPLYRDALAGDAA